jgi:MOSC domain-containing protein YiiM
MVPGRLGAIYIGARRRADLRPQDQVEAVAGRGLFGDRFFRQPGLGNAEQEVTLIELEAIEALARDHGILLEPGRARRNLLTRGVALNELVGVNFAVGEVVLRGLMLCEPCRHLEALTVAGVLRNLRHRGGLRAQIVQGGMVRTGDPVRLVPKAGAPDE